MFARTSSPLVVALVTALLATGSTGCMTGAEGEGIPEPAAAAPSSAPGTFVFPNEWPAAASEDARAPLEGEPAKAKVRPADTELSCYDDRTPPALRGEMPAPGARRCSAATITAIGAACLPSTSASACERILAAEPECGACILGSKQRLGVLYPTRHGLHAVNVAACAAHVAEAPACATALTLREACIDAACAACTSEGTRRECRAAAVAGACEDAIDPRCAEVSEKTRPLWEPKCVGASDAETFERVATLYCGGK